MLLQFVYTYILENVISYWIYLFTWYILHWAIYILLKNREFYNGLCSPTFSSLGVELCANHITWSLFKTNVYETLLAHCSPITTWNLWKLRISCICPFITSYYPTMGNITAQYTFCASWDKNGRALWNDLIILFHQRWGNALKGSIIVQDHKAIWCQKCN